MVASKVRHVVTDTRSVRKVSEDTVSSGWALGLAVLAGGV